MPKGILRIINIITVILELVLVIAAFYLAYCARFINGQVAMAVTFGQFVAIVLTFLVVYLIAAAALGLYGSRRVGSVVRELLSVFLACVISIVVVSALLYILDLDNFSRLAAFYGVLFSLVAIIIIRLLLRVVVVSLRKKGAGLRRLVVVGGDQVAQRFYQELFSDNQELETGLRYVGYISDAQSEGLPNYLGTFEQAREFLLTGGADELVIAPLEQQKEDIAQIIALCGRCGIAAAVIPTYNDYIPAQPKTEVFGSYKLVNVRSNPNANLAWHAIKRFFDIILGFIGSIFALLFLVIFAIPIKLDSKGPILFKQERSGKMGSTFFMYKFRTMVNDAESMLDQLMDSNEADGPVFKMEHDPRITKVGRFLRKTSIDEFPQFWNVLKGDMSIVGPRPPLPKEVAQYTDLEWGRLAVRPGLTCYWQVSGRSDIPFEEWMKLDLKYVEEQGFLTDLKIILKTFKAVFTGDGAR